MYIEQEMDVNVNFQDGFYFIWKLKRIKSNNDDYYVAKERERERENNKHVLNLPVRKPSNKLRLTNLNVPIIELNVEK